MSLPVNPTNGDKYKNLEWSDTVGGWIKSKDLVVNTFSTNQLCFHGQNVGASHVVYSGTYYKPTVIKFNVGNAFNTSTGLFTAQQAGLYCISFASLIHTSATTSHSYLGFEVNGVRISGYAHSPYNFTRDYDSLASTFLVQLQVGDTLGCKITTLNGAAVYSSKYSGMDITFIK